MVREFLFGQLSFFGLLSGLLALVTALTIHEFAHAYSAHRMGDDTAKRLGRVSLNPMAHYDLLGTTLILLGGFGWGKPVPVDPSRLRNQRFGMLWVSLWGPLSNILTATALALMIRWTPFADVEALAFLNSYVVWTMNLSLMLAFFNLLPIWPLDGSKVLSGLLPPKQSMKYERFMMVWGMPLLLCMLFLLPHSLLGTWVGVPTMWFYRAVGLASF
ncbi:MAG TPA: site-2 protease family protein [Armatimonadota bacterium]